MGRAIILPGLDVLVEALPHAVLILDVDGTVVQGNAEAGRLLGRLTHPGSHLSEDLSGIAEDVRLVCAATSSEGTRPALRRELLLNDPDGTGRWLEFATAPFGAGGESLAIVSVVDRSSRHAADEALRQSERRFRNLFENAPIPVWVEDFSGVKRRLDALREQGADDLRTHLERHPEVVWELVAAIRVIDVNQRSVAFLGAPSKEALVLDVASYMTPLSFATLVDEFVVLAAGSPMFEGELPVRDASGQAQILRLIVAIDPEHGDDWSRVLVSFLDVTEQRAAEQALRSTTERLERILEGAELGTYEGDLSTGEVVADGRYHAMLGDSPGEGIASMADWAGRLHPGDIDGANTVAAAVAKGTTRAAIEYRMRHRDGHWVWIRDVAKLTSHDGQPRFISGFHQDITEQRRAEAAAREAQKLYRAIVDNATIGIWSMDAEHRTTFVNERMASMLGWSPEEVIGKPVEAFMLPEELSDHRERMSRRHEGRAGSYEHRFLRRDGSVLHAEVSAAPLMDESGQFVGSFGMFADITARKLMEVERREGEVRYETLFQNSTLGIGVTRLPDGALVEINDSFLRTFGYAYDEIVGKTTAEVGLWLDNEEREAVIDEVRRTGQAADREVRLRRRDGTLVDVLISGRAIELKGESCAIWMLHDITARKLAEQDLRRHEQRYRQLVRAWPDGFMVVDGDGRIIEANDTYCSLGGWTREQLCGMRVTDIEASESAEETRAHLERITTRGWDRFETRHRRADGTFVDVEASAVFVPETAEILSLVRDLTSRKRADEALRHSEEQLRQSQKMEAIGRLAGGVAHDFNNLLTVINANAEVALGLVRQGDPLHGDLTEILKAAGRASSLTRQLLAFSRRQYVQLRVLNLNEVVADLEKMLGRLIGEDIELRSAMSPDLHNIRADAGQVEQVLVNLVVNARDAMPRGGVLSIETSNADVVRPQPAHDGDLPPGQYVRLVVADTGHGIPDGLVSRIFEPFFTTKDKQRGTGLGLAMVYGIVRQNGGNIIVRSSPGAGASFELYFPREMSLRETDVAPMPRAAKSKGGETVLLVEDEDAVRSLLKRVLTGAGYRVLSASNGGEALLICEQPGPIDLLLTDVIMPRMSGRELADRLGALRPGLKVLFASGYTDDALVSHGVEAAGHHFLAKPFNVSDLRRKVREVLDEE